MLLGSVLESLFIIGVEFAGLGLGWKKQRGWKQKVKKKRGKSVGSVESSECET